MNSIKKIVALIICLVLCFSLCGCVQLDELKETTGILSDDKSYIELNGKKYVKTDYGSNQYDYASSTDIYVTEPDVPILLSRMEGASSILVAKGNVIIYNWSDGLYCLEGFEDTLNELLKDPQFNRVCWNNFDYEYEPIIGKEELLLKIFNGEELPESEQSSAQILREKLIFSDDIVEEKQMYFIVTDEYDFNTRELEIYDVNGKYFALVEIEPNEYVYKDIPEEYIDEVDELWNELYCA